MSVLIALLSIHEIIDIIILSLYIVILQVADDKPQWMGRFVAFPAYSSDYNLSASFNSTSVQLRMKAFGGERVPVYYDEDMRNAHQVHFPAHDTHRLLQHHYAFAFFADHKMQSFYRR